MKKRFFVLVAFVFLLGGAGSLLAAPFQNGSFEEGPSDIGDFVTLYAVNTSIPGWTVELGSADLIGAYWYASDGERSIDLSGEEPGAISQTFDTELGKWYWVQFDMAGNPDSPDLKVLVASVGDSEFDTFQYEFDTAGKSRSDMGWTTMSFTFMAQGVATKIMFESLTGGPYGPAIDNVLVIEIPRPFPEDNLPPAGAVHAYNNVLWPPNNKLVPVKLKGYVRDELSIARDGGGIGVSEAYLLVNGIKIILRDSTTNLLDEFGRFHVTTYLKAKKGARYAVKLYAADTADEPNKGLVDFTYIIVPRNMSKYHHGISDDDELDKEWKTEKKHNMSKYHHDISDDDELDKGWKTEKKHNMSKYHQDISDDD